MAGANREVRIGIPSIPANALRWWYGLFSIGTVYLTVTNTITESAKVEAKTWQEIQNIATVELAQAGAASVVGSAIIVEVGRMVFAAIFEERTRRKALEEGRREGREEGRKEGREEGREEGHEEGRKEGREEGRKEGLERERALWVAWNRLREEAEQRGEVFTEPPPYTGNRNGNNGNDVSP